MPLDTEHIWFWYLDLKSTRQVGMAANPITYTEIDAYCRLHRLVMTPWEIGLLRRLDDLALSHAGGRGSKPVENVEPAATEADVADAKMRIRSAAIERRIVRRPPKS